jgi:hypothetical protein
MIILKKTNKTISQMSFELFWVRQELKELLLEMKEIKFKCQKK